MRHLGRYGRSNRQAIATPNITNHIQEFISFSIHKVIILKYQLYSV